MPKTKPDFTIDSIPKVTYCIPVSLRDEQVKINIERIKERVQPSSITIDEPMAVVGFGPSLKKTWPQLKKFKNIITCSGAHKFLVEKGIIPTYHLDVDPRPHKVLLMGPPVKGVQYLMASCVHPKVLDHLEGQDVKLWHVFSNEEEVQRLLPKDEYAVTGGSSAGLRAMTMARFIGYTNLHLFGFDGNIEGTSHAGEHPNAIKEWRQLEYNGVTYNTTPSLAFVAKETFNELNQLPDVKFKFYGKGLTQAMAKDYTPEHKASIIAYAKPALISPEYLELNKKLHKSEPTYGMSGSKYTKTILKIREGMMKEGNIPTIGDYGMGKGLLGKDLAELNIPIWEYDPAIPGKEEPLRPVDILVCTDVLEHIEPDKLKFVLEDMARCCKQIGYFVISTRLAQKILADGRNAHLIVEKEPFWTKHLSKFFKIGKVFQKQDELHYVVGSKRKK